MKSFRPYSPEQSYLLPPSPCEWLPAGHLAFFVLGLLGELDLSGIERVVHAKDPRGEKAYAPTMMTALLLYAYATGVYSSRRIERACVEDVAFRVLAAGEQPHFTTINHFRAVHLEALSGLFVQVLRVCQSEGLVKLSHVAIDGTKMKANASKHKAMSYDRMEKDEMRLRAEIQEWFDKAQAVDTEEDKAEGAYDPQEEIRRREERLAKMARVKEALKKEVAQARAKRLLEQAEELRRKSENPAEGAKQRKEAATRAKRREQQASFLDDDDPPPPSVDADLPRNVPPHRPDGTPKPKAQRNFTDPDSRVMPRDGGWIQAYNAQAAVDEGHQIIVAAAVSNQAPDNEYFVPMLRRVVENCDAVPERATADSGYFSAAAVAFSQHIGAEPFIAVGKHHNDGSPAEALTPQQRTPARVEMRSVLETERGRQAYARRKATVEPVFGQIRAPRRFQQFSFRGLVKNRCEWLLVCLTHNLLKLWRARRPRLELATA